MFQHLKSVYLVHQMIEIDGDNQAEEEVGEVEMVEDDEVVEEHGTCLLFLMFRNLVWGIGRVPMGVLGFGRLSENFETQLRLTCRLKISM